MNFLDNGQDVVSILRNPTSYIRFHNTKHKRLHKAREQWPQLHTLLLDTSTTSREKREYLADIVQGFGMKEASHFLRNIGHKQLAILDRHLLKNLVLCGVYTTEPSVSTIKRYEEVEQAFLAYGVSINISIDELDLLFWCAQTGYILK
jgi:N-glycosylase/DNA lyase